MGWQGECCSPRVGWSLKIDGQGLFDMCAVLYVAESYVGLYQLLLYMIIGN